MTTSLYYPRSACTLKDIAQATCPISSNLTDYEASLLSDNRYTSLSEMVTPIKPITLPEFNKPLSTSDNVNSVDLNQLLYAPREQQQVLSHLCNFAGGGAVLGLSQFLSDTNIPDVVGDLNTFGGNGIGATAARANEVLRRIDEYDRALKHFEDLKNHRAAPRMVKAAELQAKVAFDKMNFQFNKKAFHYLNNLTTDMRQTINAAGRPVWESIPVRSAVDVQKLATLAKAARVLSPGFIVLDGYMRTNHVNQIRQADDPRWRREAFVQSGAFVAGIVAGSIIGLVITFSPFGLVIGLVAAGVAGVGADYLTRSGLERLYEWAF